MLPLGTSAVTVGFGFLITLDAPPLDLRTSVLLIPLAHALVALPFVVRAVAPVIRSIDPRLREAAAVLGAPPRRSWREVDGPIVARAALVGAGFAFAVSLGEFGATLFIARPDTPTLPIAIYRLLGLPGATDVRPGDGAVHDPAAADRGRGAAHRAAARRRPEPLLMAGTLALEGLTVRYGERIALDSLDLVVPAGQIVSLLGPSGSGKTTLLRIVAGLERPAAGRVTFEGRDLAAVPVHERGFGLMFQDYALFPHQDVAGNVGFGLRMAGWSPEPRPGSASRRCWSWSGCRGRRRGRSRQLSGGEQQRVALARALAPSPRLLMLDEPMGSLDRALRERLPDELRRIFEQLDLTVLYVTHDQDEALRVADRTIVLRAGRIEADGTPGGALDAAADALHGGVPGLPQRRSRGSWRGGVARTAWGRPAGRAGRRRGAGRPGAAPRRAAAGGREGPDHRGGQLPAVPRRPRAAHR